MPAERTAGDFGSRLRAARESRGISLRQIANATKISVSALEALERNDISRLPGGIFSRAFVRSYALEVGLEPEETIQDFIAQFPNDSVTAGHPTSSQVEDNVALESDRRMASTFLSIVALSVPIVGLLLYFGTSGRQLRKADEPPAATAPAPPPVPVSRAAAPVAEPPPVVPATDSEPAADAPAAAAPGAAAPDAAASRLTVALSATRACWVSATVDGQRAVQRLFQAGEEQTFDVQKELVLTAGDAAAISLKLNGADARPLGKTGEVVTKRFTLDNFKDFLITR